MYPKSFLLFIAFWLQFNTGLYAQISKQMKLTFSGFPFEFYSADIVENQNLLFSGRILGAGVNRNFIVKLDSLSNLLWARTMITSSLVSNADFKTSKVESDASPSYYFTMNPNTPDTTMRCNIIKLTGNGNHHYSKRIYSSTEFYMPRADMMFMSADTFRLAMCTDKGTIITTLTDSSSTSDSIQGVRFIPGYFNQSNYYYQYASGQAKWFNNGELIMVDHSYRDALADTNIITLTKLDAYGNLNWCKRFAFVDNISVRNIIPQPDGAHFYLLANLMFYNIPSSSIMPQYTSYILKMNASGDIVWAHKYYTYMFSNQETLKFSDIEFSVTSDTLYVTGEFRNLFGETQPVLAKMTSDGDFIESIYYEEHDEVINTGVNDMDGALLSKSQKHVLWTSPYYYTRTMYDLLERLCSFDNISINTDTSSIIAGIQSGLVSTDTVPVFVDASPISYPPFTFQFVDKCLGIGVEETSSSYVTVYPNPTTGWLSIDGNGTFNVRMTDLSGRLLMQNTGINNLDISGYPNGIYMLELMDVMLNQTQVFKIIKVDE